MSRSAERKVRAWKGWLWLEGFEGQTKQAVFVVGETDDKYRVMPPDLDTEVRLAGRVRTIRGLSTALVPKRAVTIRDGGMS